MEMKKRLIDANALIEKMENTSSDVCADYGDGFCQHGYSTQLFRLMVSESPTVDAVEVQCRCKECKYWRHYDHLGCTEFVRVCTLAYYMIDENGYCLYGAKMDGGNENGRIKTSGTAL